MRTILILALLLLPVAGDAEDNKPLGQCYFKENHRITFGAPAVSEQEWTLSYSQDHKHSSDCLATMEAAMRAMEPFIAQTFVKDQNGLSVRQVMSDTKVRGFLKAGEQWEIAKRECWRHP